MTNVGEDRAAFEASDFMGVRAREIERRKSKKTRYLVIIGVLVLSTTAAASESKQLEPCATPEEQQIAGLSFHRGQADCAADNNSPQPEYAASMGLYEVRVVVHILMDSSCTDGAIPDSMVERQIEILNEDFLAISGSLGENGSDTQVRFELASTDPLGAKTLGITRHCDDTWFADQGKYWTEIAWDPHRYLNLYTNQAGGARGYVPFLPAAANSQVGEPSDRVVVNWLAFGTDGPVPAHQLGRTATHEIGHYLGLWHVFYGGCGIPTMPECYQTGDLICDTDPDESASDSCPIGETGCGGFPVPIENYMEYTDDGCMEGFSAEQGMRMRCTLLNYRPLVFEIDLQEIFSDGFESGDTKAWSLREENR